MKTLKEFVNESLDLIEESKSINKKQAIKIAQDLINSLDDYEMDENYEAAYSTLMDIASGCSDNTIKKIASDALDTDKDDMDDRLGVFVDALEKIKNF